MPKERNARHVENYQQILILPVVAKVLEKAIHRQLYNYTFRPQHTTQDVLVSSVDDWKKALDDDLAGRIESWWAVG